MIALSISLWEVVGYSAALIAMLFVGALLYRIVTGSWGRRKR